MVVFSGTVVQNIRQTAFVVVLLAGEESLEKWLNTKGLTFDKERA